MEKMQLNRAISIVNVLLMFFLIFTSLLINITRVLYLSFLLPFFGLFNAVYLLIQRKFILFDVLIIIISLLFPFITTFTILSQLH